MSIEYKILTAKHLSENEASEPTEPTSLEAKVNALLLEDECWSPLGAPYFVSDDQGSRHVQAMMYKNFFE